MQIVAFADKSSLQCRSIRVNLAEIRLNSAKIDGGHFACLGANFVVVLPPSQENGNVLNGGTTLLNGLRILEGKRLTLALFRSEERRVGKECRSRWARSHCEKRRVCNATDA